MSKVPEFRRFLREDFKEAPNWIERLFIPLNLFLEQTYTLVNKNLTIGDNISGKWFTTSFSTGASYTTGAFEPILIPWDVSKSCEAVIVGYVREASDSYTVITNAVSVDWLQISASQVRVNYIAGLQNSKKYNAKFLLL